MGSARSSVVKLDRFDNRSPGRSRSLCDRSGVVEWSHNPGEDVPQGWDVSQQLWDSFLTDVITTEGKVRFAHRLSWAIYFVLLGAAIYGCVRASFWDVVPVVVFVTVFIGSIIMLVQHLLLGPYCKKLRTRLDAHWEFELSQQGLVLEREPALASDFGCAGCTAADFDGFLITSTCTATFAGDGSLGLGFVEEDDGTFTIDKISGQAEASSITLGSRIIAAAGTRVTRGMGGVAGVAGLIQQKRPIAITFAHLQFWLGLPRSDPALAATVWYWKHWLRQSGIGEIQEKYCVELRGDGVFWAPNCTSGGTWTQEGAKICIQWGTRRFPDRQYTVTVSEDGLSLQAPLVVSGGTIAVLASASELPGSSTRAEFFLAWGDHPESSFADRPHGVV
jgi:hypothetical protein